MPTYRPSAELHLHVVARACTEVGRPIVFAISIMIIVFLPLFTLQSVEGKTFKPLAYTVALGMLGSLIFALLLAPITSAWLMRRSKRAHRGASESLIIRLLLIFYRPLVTLFVRVRGLAVGLAIGLLVLGRMIFPRLGSEFVPRLNEGDLLVRATMAPSISLDESGATMGRFERRMLAQFPEMTRIVTRVGRGEVGAHADPVNPAEAFVALKPQEEWESAKILDELYVKMSHAFEDFLGVQFNFTQPIAAAVDELLTGTTAELAIKIFGLDMEVLKEQASAIEAVLRNVPGATDVQKDQMTGTPQLRLRVNRQAIARYGANSEQNLSVPASVGFIALFGIALENGMVLVTYLNQLVRDGVSLVEASVQGACLRLRPVLMTAITTTLGLLPLLFSQGTGSEVQRPLATVVIGGLVSSTIVTLLVIPALYKWFAAAIKPESRLAERRLYDERDQGVYQAPQVVGSDVGVAQDGGSEWDERE